MNASPSNFSSGSSKRRLSPLTWFALLTGAIFIILLIVSLAVSYPSPRFNALEGICAAGILALLASLLALFIRWISSGRNFLRFSLGVACCVVAVVLAYLFENWRGKSAWLKHRQALEAKGEKFTLKELAPPPVPDDKNFAATPLLAPMLKYTAGPGGTVWADTNGIARLEKLNAMLPSGKDVDKPLLGDVDKGTLADPSAWTEFYRGNTNYPQAAESATPAQQVLTALSKFDVEMSELYEAAATRPYSRFPIHYDEQGPPWGILLPHLARVKQLTTLANVKATAEVVAGRPEDAFRDLKLGFRISEGLKDEPLLISHLVRIASLSLNLRSLREGLARHQWTDSQLVELETLLAQTDLLAEYKNAMRGERAIGTSGLEYLVTTARHGGRTEADFADIGGSKNLRLMPSGWYYQNMLTISRLNSQIVQAVVDENARLVNPQLSESLSEKTANMKLSPYTIFARMLFPAVEKAVQKTAHMQFSVDAARVACAVERYRLAAGKLPENLETLAPKYLKRVPRDVIGGQPLHWRTATDGGHLIYSVGWDEKDNGGELALKKGKREDLDLRNGDWVWFVPSA